MENIQKAIKENEQRGLNKRVKAKYVGEEETKSLRADVRRFFYARDVLENIRDREISTKMDSMGVASYCRRNNLFTSGDMEQYEKVLSACDDNTTPVHDIAVMIWICSDTEKTVEEIENDIAVKGE